MQFKFFKICKRETNYLKKMYKHIHHLHHQDSKQFNLPSQSFCILTKITLDTFLKLLPLSVECYPIFLKPFLIQIFFLMPFFIKQLFFLQRIKYMKKMYLLYNYFFQQTTFLGFLRMANNTLITFLTENWSFLFLFTAIMLDQQKIFSQ